MFLPGRVHAVEIAPEDARVPVLSKQDEGVRKGLKEWLDGRF